MLIEILNWSKINPRADVKNPSWFRLNANFLTRMFKYSSDEKCVWIGVLGEACLKQKTQIDCDIELTATLLKTSTDVVKTALLRFEADEMIKIHTSRTRTAHVPRTSRVRTAHVPLQTDIQTDREYIPPTPQDDPFDRELAESWAAYATQVSRTVKPKLDEWTQTVRRLREIDRFTEADLRLMLEHAKDPASWWHKLASSLPALRGRSKDGLLKAENLLNSARKNKPAQSEPQLIRNKNAPPAVTLEELLAEENAS